jgi:hypothetical protein
MNQTHEFDHCEHRPNQLLHRTGYVFTPFAVAKAAPTQPAAELRRWALQRVTKC